jgi:DNA-binding response OmpR family regulator
MRVLLMSGYDGNQIDRDEAESGDTAFLPKPFSTEILRRKVRAVLDGPQQRAPQRATGPFQVT